MTSYSISFMGEGGDMLVSLSADSFIVDKILEDNFLTDSDIELTDEDCDFILKNLYRARCDASRARSIEDFLTAFRFLSALTAEGQKFLMRIHPILS